jgi:hypothetical protein
MYAPLYERHDASMRKRRADLKVTEERSRKRATLQTRMTDLTELPALSSFLQIKELSTVSSEDAANNNESSVDSGGCKVRNGFERMERCRMALNALDNGGWKRSYHQRLFHEAYIAACARPFWKLDPPGSFARAHQKILETNNWDSLSQEILISTPRRCGSVCCCGFFCAFACLMGCCVAVCAFYPDRCMQVRKNNQRQHVCSCPHVLMCSV